MAAVVKVLRQREQRHSAVRPVRELRPLCHKERKGHPLYRPLLSRYMELAVRTELSPNAMIADLRRKIIEVNPHLAIGDFSTMEMAVEDSIGAQK
jgi:hypothetical protein